MSLKSTAAELYEGLHCHYNASTISVTSKIEVVVGLLTKYCVDFNVLVYSHDNAGG